MREIKFRAWDYDDCKMYNVMSYSPITFGEIKPHVGIYPIDESKPVTVTQISTNFKLVEYTGLKDKNGREIYEGDIVNVNRFKNPKQLEKVQHYTTGGGFAAIHPFQDDGYHWASSQCEVFGNIFENPELLK